MLLERIQRRSTRAPLVPVVSSRAHHVPRHDLSMMAIVQSSMLLLLLVAGRRGQVVNPQRVPSQFTTLCMVGYLLGW